MLQSLTAVGTINNVSAIAGRTHEAGAFVAVDAVHAAPHFPIDRDAIGADILTCSASKSSDRTWA